MRELRFTKMHGLGNCYIYVNMFEETLHEEEMPELAQKVSDRNTGIGSDGMILICPSESAPVKMRIFNSDGSEGKNCGNGLRCVAKYVYEHGMVKETGFHIETLGGLVYAQVFVENGIVSNVLIDMGEPRLKRKELPMKDRDEETVLNEVLTIDEGSFAFTGVSMGNPHIITFVEEIEQAPVTSVGPKLEKHELFPEGVNVEFVEVVNETELHFRVWERGSGVTQACGTGACAAAVAAVLNKRAKRDEDIIVHLAGGDLTIRWTEKGNVLMTGAAETICTGTYYI
ncbi:diaminopimelate epimerase [Bacillus taeanensis]|uniref:Diaminopimelate epimerase n=1 Tax=Bacillus taeanensis TaxID=273032 RepID=A0A366XY17_9BACI|nr:diaminopimelate epimerase [Bacillus taeanensis]RBW71300.1 diaminopimelate epimerase [Bacillus taeanensis]